MSPWLVARRRIEQNPLDPAPAVPRGAVGTLEDEADDLLWVDFGAPWGVVACDPSEVKEAGCPRR